MADNETASPEAMEGEIDMPLKLEEMRGLLMQALRQERWNQVAELEIAVGNLKAKMHPQASLKVILASCGPISEGLNSAKIRLKAE